MPYALLQTELGTPSFQRVRQALMMMPGLTALDAQTVVNDAFGILLKNLPQPEAEALQGALLKEGVETVVVDEADLPQIPPAKLVKRIDCHPDRLVAYDSIGRSTSLAWQDILLIAAGNVRLQQLRKQKATLEEPHVHGSGITYDTVADSKTREETAAHLMLDLIPRDRAWRYCIVADDFSFGCLGSRVTRSLPRNFLLLIQELCAFAPHAGLNRGALAMGKQTDQLFTYPTKHAFQEEVTWMLWRISLM